MKKKLLNAFTVDVEDYFHVAALSDAISINSWDSFECRVEENTDKILALLDERKQKATFFILGWVAERYPDLVRKIDALGHEIASHGMFHQLIYNQSIEQFKQETLNSKNLLEGIIQKPVIGYRAATYSITEKSLWALDILTEAGFLYDSSIFPMRHDKYGMTDICPVPHILTTPNGSKIIEFPISTLKNSMVTLPIAGGGYFRLFPYFFSKWGLKLINKKNQPFVFYIHPWEVDPNQPKVKDISLFSKFRHYNNLEKCETRLSCLLQDFEFTTMKEVINRLELF